MRERKSERPTVMLVGTGHWSNPGRDYHSPDYDDMLAPGRQAQIRSALELLAGFAPTKIALEVMVGPTDDLNRDYRAYRAGDLLLTASERHQIEFQLASRLGHDQVFGIDWHDPSRDIGWDAAIAAAQQLGQDDLVTAFTQTSIGSVDEPAAQRDWLQERTVSQMLLESSDLVGLAANH